MKCNYIEGVFNACLTIEYAGDGRWDTTEILACNGGHPNDDQIGSLPLISG